MPCSFWCMLPWQVVWISTDVNSKLKLCFNWKKKINPFRSFSLFQLALQSLFWWPQGKLIFFRDILCPLLLLDHTHADTRTMSFFLSDTRFLIIPQYSLSPLKTPIKYEWVFPPLLFWLDSAEHQPPQSSAFMMLSCHQLDLIWSAPSPATRPDGAVRWWRWWRGGMRPSATC